MGGVFGVRVAPNGVGVLARPWTALRATMTILFLSATLFVMHTLRGPRLRDEADDTVRGGSDPGGTVGHLARR